MSFFETMALLELASKRDIPRQQSGSEGAGLFWFALFAYLMFGLPVALVLEFRKRRWLFMAGMIAVFALDEIIAYAEVHNGMWSLIIANVIFGMEYLLYIGLAWVSRKISREGSRDQSSNIGIWSYAVLGLTFLTFMIVFKVVIGTVMSIDHIFAFGLAAVPAIFSIMMLRAWFVNRSMQGKRPVPIYVSLLFIPAFISPFLLMRLMTLH